MASRRLGDLTQEMQDKAKFVLGYCQGEDVDLLIYCTLRSLDEQAILFRSSDKTGYRVKVKIRKFRERGFGFLADIIEKVGPQKYDGWKTNAAPGESWHGYREAFDAVPLLGGKAMWSYKSYKKGWDVYGEACYKAGLEWGGNWIKYKDMPHAQLRPGGNPLKILTPEEVKFILTKNKLL